MIRGTNKTAEFRLRRSAREGSSGKKQCGTFWGGSLQDAPGGMKLAIRRDKRREILE
jgi:hypothetical protein